MKHTPATPLPWKAETARKSSNFGDYQARVIAAGPEAVAKIYGGHPATQERTAQQAAYIAHAANAYPRLVQRAIDREAQLRRLISALPQKLRGEVWAMADADQVLLAELGE